MKTITLTISVLLAVILCAFAFYFGVYPNHDRQLGTFLLCWALVVVWLGGLIGSRVP